MARSLLDGINTTSRSSSKGGGDNSNKVKLIAAVSLLVVAVGFLVWYYALRNTAPKLAPVDQEQVQAAQQEQERQVREAQSRGGVVIGGD